MLTEIRCRSAKPSTAPFKLADALGLFLFVTTTGFKSWRLKYRVGGKEKLLTLGSYPDVTLAQARILRDQARAELRANLDPSTTRKQRRAATAVAVGDTLGRHIEDWLERRTPGWQPHYAACVRRRLQYDVVPRLGRIPIADITTPMILELLREVEKRGALDVARRLRQHLDDIMSSARVAGAIVANPAADLRRAMRSQICTQRPAVRTIEGARIVLSAIEEMNVEPTTRMAARLLALTAVRPAMVRLAEPREFERLDGPDPIWRIPAAKMKLTAARRSDVRFEFVVPLAPAAVEVVRAAMPLATSDLLFPSRHRRRLPMSDNTLSKLFRSAGFTGVHVPHGWRSTFSTVMNEIAAIENRVGDRDIIDLMLAHVPKGVEAAYNRYAYLPRRRELALEWAGLLMEGVAPAESLLLPRKRGGAEVRLGRSGSPRDGRLDAAPGAGVAARRRRSAQRSR